VQITGPPPVLQQVLHSTCQHLLPAAEACGDANSVAIPVVMTAANKTTATHLLFCIVHLLVPGNYHGLARDGHRILERPDY
jgi:hypothetical protein